jgi:hypothetical protein
MARRDVRFIDGPAIAIGQVAVPVALRGDYLLCRPSTDDHQHNDDACGENADERTAIIIVFGSGSWRGHGKPREFADDLLHRGRSKS